MTFLLTLLYAVGLALGLSTGTGPQRLVALTVLVVLGARALHRRAGRRPVRGNAPVPAVPAVPSGARGG